MVKLKIIAVLSAILAFGSLYAQNDEFYAEVKGLMSEYDKIAESYYSGAEMSIDDYTVLYYGYTFTDAYKPDHYSTAADSLIRMKKYADAYNALYEEHRKDPTSLQVLFDLLNMSDYLGKQKESDLFQKHYINIIKAILQSCGDGLSSENAIKVNRVTDEFQILSTVFKAASIVSKELSPDYIDKVTVKDSDGKIKDVFFDFTRYMAVTQQ